MKDKLTKVGKKKSYYMWRKVIVFASVLAFLGACIAIPVSIRVHSKANVVLVVH